MIRFTFYTFRRSAYAILKTLRVPSICFQDCLEQQKVEVQYRSCKRHWPVRAPKQLKRIKQPVSSGGFKRGQRR